MQRRRLIVAALLVVVAIVIARQVAVPSNPTTSEGPVSAGRAVVVKVADGDTVTVRMDGYEGPVRIIGIDTPEIERPGKPGGCYGEQATAATRAWVLGRTVKLVPGREQRDRYGRLLATITPEDGPIAGRDLSRVLALSGFARALAIAPNIDDADAIERRVRTAQREDRGLWSACGFSAAFPGKNGG
jgi:micrococcal nuclease